MRKQDVLDMLAKMPDEIDVDALMYALHLRRKLERGLSDIAAGRVVPHAEVEREMEAWQD